MPSFLKKKKSFTVFLALILLQLALISIQTSLKGRENYVEKIIFSIFAPLQHGVVLIIEKSKELWNNYFSLRDVRFQNNSLKKEIFFLRQQNILFKSMMEQYKGEAEIQKRLQQIYKSIIQARIIGFDASNYYRSIVINRGFLDGIKQNMVVLDKFGNLLGHVVGPVTLKEARVQLITDMESGVSVMSEKGSPIGILTGEGNGHCRLKYILSTDSALQEGDFVVTTGYDGIFPPGIRVGVVASVSETSTLFKKVRVEPFFNFQRLNLLAVIRLNAKEFF